MKERLLATVRRADDYQQRRGWVGLPYAVIRKFSEDQASNLAALIAYYAFFSIFPLILAATTILGYLLQGNPQLQHTITHSFVAQIPLIGSSIGKQNALTGNIGALVLGLVLAIWSGLAVARTAQTAFNTVYDVPKVDRPDFVRKTARALMLVVIIGGGLIVSTFISGFVTGSSQMIPSIHLGLAGEIAGAIVTIAIDVGVFTLAFNWLTVREMTWRQALPGAAFAGVVWFVLQQATTAIVTHKLHGSTGTYGQFAIVIVLLSWFYLAAQFVLLGAELNVVLQDRLWPRGLVGKPQTDADFRAFERYAEEQRYVHQEDVDTNYPETEQKQQRERALREEQDAR